MMTESMSALQYGALNLGDQSHLHMGDGLTDEGRHLVHGQTIVLSWLGRDVGRVLSSLLLRHAARRCNSSCIIATGRSCVFLLRFCADH
jgi:hypothetical protein